MAINKTAESTDPYAYLNEDFPLEGWAWEFLRRRSDYVDAYRAHKKDKQAISEAKDKEIVGYYPNKGQEENFTDWAIRCEEEGFISRELTASQMIALDWGLWDMYDPEKAYDRKIHFVRQRPPSYPIAIETQEDIKRVIRIEEFAEDLYVEAVISRQGVIVFNLEDGIEEQLEKAKSLLLKKKDGHKATVEDEKRKRVSNWKIYLRVLDAYNANPKIPKYELGKLTNTSRGDNKGLSDAGSKNLNAALNIQQHYRSFLTESYTE